jgi:hypothetical protein
MIHMRFSQSTMNRARKDREIITHLRETLRNEFLSQADDSNVPPPGSTHHPQHAAGLRSVARLGKEAATPSAHTRKIPNCCALNISLSESHPGGSRRG